MDFAYSEIGRPPHEYGMAAVTPEHYRGLMVQTIRQNRVSNPFRPAGTPHLADSGELRRAPFINHGIWKIGCACGDHPIYSPEWRVANCFKCGAMFVDVPPPEEYRKLEGVLMKRRLMEQRNWTTETLEELRAENIAHGDPV